MANGFTDARDTQVPAQATGELGGRTVGYQPQRHSAHVKQPREGFSQGILTGLAELGQKYASMRMQSEMERAYVDGQDQHKSQVIEEELNSNWFTRPFVRGGWRDQQYLADLAEDFKSETAEIQNRGKKLNPEEYEQERRARRAAFLESANVQGLSARTRAKAIDMLMQQDEQLGKLYAKEHSEWSAFLGAQADNAAVQTFINSLPNDVAVQQGADISSQLGLLYTYMDTGLEHHSELVRGKIQGQLLSAVYDMGHVSAGNALYDMMMRGGLIEAMTVEDASALGDMRRKALDKAGVQYKAPAVALLNELQVLKDSGQALDIRKVQELSSMIAEHGLAKELTVQQWEAFFRIKESARGREDKLRRSQAWKSGDVATMRKEAWRQRQIATDDWNLSLQGYDTTAEAVAAHLGPMLDHKWTAPADEYIQDLEDSLGTAMQYLERDEPIPEEHLEIIEATLGILKAADSTEHTRFAASVVHRMDSKQQALVMHVLSNPGQDFRTSLRQGTAAVAASMQRDVHSAATALADVEHAEAVGKYLEDEHSIWWHNIKARLGILGAHATASDHTFNQYRDRVAAKVPEVRSRAGMKSLSDEHIFALAAAEVQDSFLSWHPRKGRVATVFMPEGFQRQLGNISGVDGKSILGGAVPGEADIMQALQELYDTPTEGTAVEFYTEADGSIQVWYYDMDSPATRWQVRDKEIVDPVRVAGRIHLNHARGNERFIGANSRVGSVKKMQDVHGRRGAVDFAISGVNPLGLDAEKVQQWKSELADAEKLSTKPYDDGFGNLTVGVGRNLNAKPLRKPRVQAHVMRGGDISLELAQELYEEDSNDALLQAHKIASDYGFENDVDTLLALADMTFQLGEGNSSEGTRSFVAALPLLADGDDYEAFSREIRGSKWYRQTPTRAETFLKRTKKRFDNAKRNDSAGLPIGTLD